MIRLTDFKETREAVITNAVKDLPVNRKRKIIQEDEQVILKGGK